MAIIELEFDGAILSDEHSASSYGQPVLVYEGRAYGPADVVPTGTVFGDEPAYRMSQRASNFLTIPPCPEHHQGASGKSRGSNG